MSDWKPQGYNSLSPYLICERAEALIAFLEAVFGGTLIRRFDRPDGSLMHAEVRIDDTILMLGGGAAEMRSSPHLHVYVADVDTLYARALANGATPIQQPERKRADDDYRGGFHDPFGNAWWVASQ